MGDNRFSMRLLLPICAALLLTGAAPSEPHDPDLKLGKTCSGHPAADALAEALPTYAKELVVMWPRAGKGERDGGCVSVARLTIVNHQGVLLTLSVLAYEADRAPDPRDYRVFADDAMPRAVLEVKPETGRTDLLLEMAGAPSTSRESLEATLEFVPVEDLVTRIEALLGG